MKVRLGMYYDIIGGLKGGWGMGTRPPIRASLCTEENPCHNIPTYRNRWNFMCPPRNKSWIADCTVQYCLLPTIQCLTDTYKKKKKTFCAFHVFNILLYIHLGTYLFFASGNECVFWYVQTCFMDVNKHVPSRSQYSWRIVYLQFSRSNDNSVVLTHV